MTAQVRRQKQEDQSQGWPKRHSIKEQTNKTKKAQLPKSLKRLVKVSKNCVQPVKSKNLTDDDLETCSKKIYTLEIIVIISISNNYKFL